MHRPIAPILGAALLGLSCLLGACTAERHASGDGTAAPSGQRLPTVVTILAADLPPVEAIASLSAPDAPARIVTLAMGAGETLVALGAASHIVGRDETSDLPQLESVPVVTRGHEVSAERVLSLDPDLVIADARTTPSEALQQIRQAGVTVAMVPEAWSLTDIAPRVTAVAAAIGADPAPVLAALPSAPADPVDNGPRVAFLYLRGTAAIYLLGGRGSGADSLIAAAGGTDAGAQANDTPFVPLTAEAIARLNPDVLLVMTKGLESVNGAEGLAGLPGVAQTRAGRERRIVAVDDAILLSFGPRTPALVERLRAALAQASR